MELRHLRYFVAVAEERHFTRAAERLGIRQPPLSLQIRRLEREIGAPLFRRLTRGAELTESGALLFEDARRILDQVDRAVAEVQSRARGETGRIRVGFAGATYFQPIVPGIVRAFRERYPGVVLSPEQSNTPRLVDQLHGGDIDVAFVRPPVGEANGLGIQLLIEEPMLLVLPAGHALTGATAVPLAALSEETFILFPRQIGPGLHDSIIAACRRAGFTPRLGQEAPQMPAMVPMVAAGFGVSVVPQSIRQIHSDGAVYLEIEGEAPRAAISLAFRRDEHSIAVRNFIAAARHFDGVSDPRIMATGRRETVGPPG
jgi:DNA-binding transcriptional LysR family regulator